MSANANLSPPGSASYSSSTLHVGDGTWDSSRDDFLLPNIQGLNFDTMQYNGMGNRFRGLPEYHTLVTGHGVLAAITFLGIVPAAILIAHFYHINPRLALRIHITLQVFVVLLTTVILVLGYFAVGPVRSLTNPHHGIGVAIYVLVLLQAFGGWIIHRIERGKVRYYLPIKLMLHQWVGRAIALLALAQIPIGLTLYGSPLFLFILYALVMTAYLVLYFVLTYQSHKREGARQYERGSYVTGTQTELSAQRSDHHHSRLGALGAAIAGGAGIEALRRRYRSRERGRNETDAGESAHGSRTEMSGSYVDEKYTEDNRSRTGMTWRERLFGGAADVAGVATVRRFVDRRRGIERESDVGSYRAPHGGPVTAGGPTARGINETRSEMDFARVEEGRPTAEQDDHWRRVEAMEAAQEAGMSRTDLHSHDGRHTVRTYDSRPSGPRSAGPWEFSRFLSFRGIRDYFRERRERKEQDRIDSERQREYENERMFHRGEQQPLYPGTPTRGDGFQDTPTSPPAAPFEGSATNRRDFMSMDESPGARALNQRQLQDIPPPPGPPRSDTALRPPPPSSRNMPPPPPAHQSSPTSRSLATPDRNLQLSQISAGPPRATSATRAAQTQPISSPPPVASPSRNPRGLGDDATARVDSPPVSVKVKMHNDGRHVTLRRLSEEEAAIERESRRSNPRGRQRESSLSDVGEASAAGFRRRDQTPLPQRTDPISSQQTSELQLPPAQQAAGVSPPSASAGGYGSGLGTAGGGPEYETGTDLSNYDVNRRRRRAERAKAQQARHARMSGSGGGKVEFV